MSLPFAIHLKSLIWVFLVLLSCAYTLIYLMQNGFSDICGQRCKSRCKALISPVLHLLLLGLMHADDNFSLLMSLYYICIHDWLQCFDLQPNEIKILFPFFGYNSGLWEKCYLHMLHMCSAIVGSLWCIVDVNVNQCLCSCIFHHW